MAYIIKATNQDNKVMFYGQDHQSGGYGWWSSALQNAKFFSTFGQARDFLEDAEFTQEQKMSNGVIDPPRMIHNGCGLNSNKLKGNLMVEICEISFNTQFVKNFEAKIKIPQIIYKYED